jgi:tetratricopeptide (TPR) repeat protein
MRISAIDLSIFIVTLILYGTTNVCAQKVDSLKKLLIGKGGVERAKVLVELGYASLRDPSKVAKYGAEAYAIGTQNKDSLIIVEGGRLLAYSMRVIGDVDSSIRVCSKILRIAKKKKYTAQTLKILNGLAVAHSFRASYDKALESYFEYLAMPESKNDSSNLASVFNNIGLIYFKLHDYDNALGFYGKGLELRMLRRDTVDLDLLFINLALCYAYKGDSVNATRHVKKGLEICTPECSPLNVIQADFVRGLVELNKGRERRAEAYFISAYNKAKEVRHLRFQLDNIDYLSNLYIQRGENHLALKYLNEAEGIISRSSPYRLERMKIYVRLSEVYEAMGDLEQTVNYQKQYIQLKDSVFNQELTNNLVKIEADYLEQENQAKIVAQEQVLLLKDEIISRQIQLTVAIVFVVIILSLFVVGLVRTNSRKQRMNRILEGKVRQRTFQLQTSYNDVTKSAQEADVLLKRNLQNVRESTRRLNSLYNLAIHETNAAQHRIYLDKMNEIVTELSGAIDVKSQLSSETP